MADRFNSTLKDFLKALVSIFPSNQGVALTSMMMDEYNGTGIRDAFSQELNETTRKMLADRDERLITDSELMRKLLQYSLVDFSELWTLLSAENKKIVWFWLDALVASV